MDDEAASQQLMSEARANIHSADYEGPAVPLNFDSTSQDTTTESSDSSKKKARKLGRMQRGHRNNVRGSPLPTYSLQDLQAFIGTSPSRSRTFPSTMPSTQIEVPDTQTEAQAVSSSASKKRLKQDTKSTKTVQPEADSDNGNTIPATPYDEHTTEDMPSSVEAVQSQASQKRRRKNKRHSPTNNANLDPAEVSETPAASQETASRTPDNDFDMQDGELEADEQPLTPRDLLGRLNAERSRKSQSAGKAPSQDDSQEDAVKRTDAEAEQSDAAPTANTSKTPERSASKKKNKAKKAKQATETPALDADVPVEIQQETPSQPLTPEDSNGEGSSSHGESASSRTTTSTNGRKAARYSIGGITRKPRVSRADPNKDYRRAPDDDDRTAADQALERAHELGHPPDKRTKGDFTADEKELLRRAIRDYQERSGLDTADLVEIIQWTQGRDKGDNDHQSEAHFKADCDAFWDEIKNTGLLRGIKELKKHVRATYHVFQRGRWSQEEDEQLRELANLHPGQWKLIATQLNRLETDTYNHWKDYVRHGEHRLTKRWTTDEEENLVRVLSLVCQRVEDSRAESGKPPLDDYYPVINWHEVCREIGHTRSRLQCQSKWKIMISRKPPAGLDIEIKPRKSPPKDASAKSRKDRDSAPGPDDMLWGDKFDLIAELSEQAASNGSTSIDEIAWRDIAQNMDDKWSVRTLRTAFKQLCEHVLDPVAEDEDDLTQRLGSLYHFIKKNHRDEIEDRYHAAQGSEAVDKEEAEETKEIQVKPSKKRKRRSDAGSSTRPSKKRSKPLPSVSKTFKSKEIITDSESEL